MDAAARRCRRAFADELKGLRGRAHHANWCQETTMDGMVPRGALEARPEK